MRKVITPNFSRRTITKFLWFPVAIGNVVKWLETATWEEEYFKSKDSLIGYWFKLWWVE